MTSPSHFGKNACVITLEPDIPSRRELANALRVLAMDAVEAAQSGHPGMPMGMADLAEVLWNDAVGGDAELGLGVPAGAPV